MKKIIAMLLSLIMICSLATVAFADETETPAELTDMTKAIIKKNYENANGGVSPAETFTFDIEFKGVTDAGVEYDAATQGKPTVDPVIYAEGDAGKVLIAPPNVDYVCVKDIVVTLPSYNAVGIYTYEITEKAGTTAGVTYHPDPIKLVVTVIEQDGKIRVAAVHTEEEGQTKNDMITNVYESGTLDVSKTVTGNLGDKTKPFAFTVTFTAPDGKDVLSTIGYTLAGTAQTALKFVEGEDTLEVTFNLTDGQTASFTNLPAGVAYTVVEDTYTDYETSRTSDTGTIEAGDEDKAEFTNHKQADVDTGIALDSAPYFLMLAVAVVGMVALVSKKRYEV